MRNGSYVEHNNNNNNNNNNNLDLQELDKKE